MILTEAQTPTGFSQSIYVSLEDSSGYSKLEFWKKFLLAVYAVILLVSGKYRDLTGFYQKWTGVRVS
jgi:hypothetical protein